MNSEIYYIITHTHAHIYIDSKIYSFTFSNRNPHIYLIIPDTHIHIVMYILEHDIRQINR